MLQIGEILVSDTLLREAFVCNLEKCKGACCEEGDLGAPLLEEELKILEENFASIAPFLTSEALESIAKQGLYIKEPNGEYSTPTLGGKACVYAFKSEDQVWQCGIEKAYKEQKINFQKPISCHLYPARVLKNKHIEALNYHQWHICSPACELGKALKIPIYQFIAPALIRQYGQEWYNELSRVAEAYLEQYPIPPQ
ncbi:MAG: DUF3109 family protein [Cytophagales bacterium]|nr:MAG: DUF3109 family protein [Cytophagales bacterium]